MLPNEPTSWVDWAVTMLGAFLLAGLLVLLPACASRYQPPGGDLWKAVPPELRDTSGLPQDQKDAVAWTVLRMLHAEDSNVRA